MSRPGSGVLVAFLAAAACWLPASASGQNVTGAIVGTIADTQGQVVPGATVTVVNENTGESRHAVSDARGNFQVTTLPPGTYTVKVEMANFSTAERTRNVLSAAAFLYGLAVEDLQVTVCCAACHPHL